MADRNPRYVSAIEKADVAYADGVSISRLARFAGAENIERYPTTDLGIDCLSIMALALGRPPRVALLGGRPGVSQQAGEALLEKSNVEIVYAAHGFHDDYRGVLTEVRQSVPDIVFLGLGAPKEHLFVADNLQDLPQCLIVTCGGWFGFLRGAEKRAPQFFREAGLEWMYRAMRRPGDLVPRYAKGAVLFAARMIEILICRAR